MSKTVEYHRTDIAEMFKQVAMTAFLVACVIGTGSFVMFAEDKIIAGDKLPKFKITTKRDNDKIAVNVENDTTIFSVESPFGISQAVIERTEEKWPKNVAVRLHLKGLERCRISNGKTTLDAAVSVHAVRLWKDGKEDEPLDSQNPFWMEIRAVGGDGKPAAAIPLNEGYFEMTLPRAFTKDNPKSITIDWIDFYR